MITRVSIENLVIVERAELEPGAGLTSITGETGAGKTLLTTAISLLFGGDAAAGQVGPAADHAWIEGEFEVDDSFWSEPSVAALRQLRPDDDTPLVLARRVDANGRSRALAWGRTVAKGDLAAAGQLLVATAGQHVQVRLRSADHQRSAVDAAGDDAHAALLRDMASAHAAWAAARDEQSRIERDAREAGTRAEQVRDDLARIEELDPSHDDFAQLRSARERARHHAQLVDELAGAAAVLDGAGDGGGAIDLAGRAWNGVDRAAAIDESLATLAADLLAAQEQLSDAASQLAGRLAQLAEGPHSLDEIEDRLSAYDEQIRRHGGTIDSLLAAREQLARQANIIDDADTLVVAARQRADMAHAAAQTVAAQLTASRRDIASRLAGDVQRALDELGMAGSVFRVDVDDSVALSTHGADRVSLLLAPSAGIDPRPVAQVASGGELSRVALALLIATTAPGAARGGVGTILFDEIDAGIGGHTAHAVASMLRSLADRRQVLCITHLPQVAARADAHVVIDKRADAHGGVTTTLRALTGEAQVLDELQRMLGADASDTASREHARQLRGPRFFAPTTSAPPFGSHANT